jgi:NAD(P)H-hydrate epimerase
LKELNAEEMKQMDYLAVEEFNLPIKDLMSQAGKSIAEVAQQVLKKGKIVAVSGKGNNGGDAIHAARLLNEKGLKTVLVLAFPEEELNDEAKRELKDFKAAGLNARVFSDSVTLERILAGADLIIDGLLGFGLSGEPRGKAAELIELINAAGKKVLAVDVPSGFDLMQGKPSKICVHANYTVTLTAPKKGLLHSEKSGQVFLVDIGFPDEAYAKFGLDKEKLFQSKQIVKM